MSTGKYVWWRAGDEPEPRPERRGYSLDTGLQGVIPAGSNPPYPPAHRGYSWLIVAPGVIGGDGGIEVDSGDFILCMKDDTPSGSQEEVGALWQVYEKT